MLVSLIGGLLGFGSSVVPQFFKYFQDKKDKAHELEILRLQIEAQRQGHVQRVGEITVQGDVEESKALYSYAKAEQAQLTGNKWIDGFTALLFAVANFLITTVRPTVTYGVTGLYSYMKIVMVSAATTTPEVLKVWTEEDGVIFMTVLGHWFGSRMMQRVMKR